MSSQDLPVSSLKNKMTNSWSFKNKAMSSLPYTLAVAITFLAALWIRILPAKTVFLPDGTVKFVTNDAWYHIRTLNLLLNNYTNRIRC